MNLTHLAAFLLKSTENQSKPGIFTPKSNDFCFVILQVPDIQHLYFLNLICRPPGGIDFQIITCLLCSHVFQSIPTIFFERYADYIIVHCHTQQETESMCVKL